MSTRKGPGSFPMFLVPVIMEDEGGDMALGIAVDKKPAERASVGIKQGRLRLRAEFGDRTMQVLLIELVALPEDGNGKLAVRVVVLARESVHLSLSELDGHWMQGNDDALRLGSGLGVVEAVREEPLRQFR